MPGPFTIALGAFSDHPGILVRMMVDEAEQYSHELFGDRDATLIDEVPQPVVGEPNAVMEGAGSAQAYFIGIEERRDA